MEEMEVTTMRISKEEHEWLRWRAFREHRSLSSVIREIIRTDMQRRLDGVERVETED